MLLPLLAAVSAAIALHTVACAFAGAGAGARVLELRLGVGPLITLHSDPLVRVGIVPLGGWVQFDGAVASPDGEALPDGAFLALRPETQALVHLAGPVAVLTLASALLGPTAALACAWHAPAALVDALHPTAMRALLDSLPAMDSNTLLGRTIAAIGAFNLIPLPTLAGGQALLAALNAFAAAFLGSATLKEGEFHIPGTFIGL